MKDTIENMVKSYKDLSKYGSTTIFFHPKMEFYEEIVTIIKELGFIEETEEPAGYATKGLFNIKIFKPIL